MESPQTIDSQQENADVRMKLRYSKALMPLSLTALMAVMVASGIDAHAQTTDEAAVQVDAFPKVRITKRDCRRLVRHYASADVAYKPGVDVRGNPVVDADVNDGFAVPLPDVYEFNVTKDLSAYLDGPEDQLAADKAAAIAAERSVTATDAAVSSAALSLSGAQTVSDTAATAAKAAQTAADAAPNNAALATAATTAQATAKTAVAGLAQMQSAYDATQTAAASDDVSGALKNAQAILAAAKATGYTQNATASTASTTATQAASDSTSADTAALNAAEVVAKSEGITLNVGTVRFDIKTGAMTFNGQPLTNASEAELAAHCQAMMSAK